MENISVKKIMDRYTHKIINEEKGIVLYKIPKNSTGTRKITYSHYKVRITQSGKQKDLEKIKKLKDFEYEKQQLLSIKTTITITRGNNR